MKKFYNILLFFITFACCACANEKEMIGKNFTKWQCLSIDTQDKSAVANLNKDIIFTIVHGYIPTNSHIANEIKLQKQSKLYQEIMNCVEDNKKGYSLMLPKLNRNAYQGMNNGVNLSCLVASVFLPEMAIAIKNGDFSLTMERFEQTLYMLPITDVGYSFAIIPLFSLIPQSSYYSHKDNNIRNMINMVENLLKNGKTVLRQNQNILEKQLYFFGKNIISLETLRINLYLMDFYQQNQRWCNEDEINKIPLFFAEKVNYRQADGAFSYQLFFPELKMRAEFIVFSNDKITNAMIDNYKKLTSLKITSLQ